MFNIKHFYSVSFNIVLLSTVHATLIILYVLFGYFPSYILYIVIISLCLFVFLTWAFHSRAIALYSMCIYTYIIHTCTYINIHTHIYIYVSTRSLGSSPVPGKGLCWYLCLCFLYAANYKSSQNQTYACCGFTTHQREFF